LKALIATVNRELRAYFFSPLAYVVLTCFLIVHGVTFSALIGFLSDPRSPAGPPMQYFFGATFLFWLAMLFVGAVLSMRLISEERRSGTIEVLMTAPITEGQVVAGKFLAALVFYIFLWLPTLTYVGLVSHYGGQVDWGPIASSYLGVVGIGALFLAVGLFASSLTKNQLIAAILAFAMLFVLILLGLLDSLVNTQALKDLLGYVNLLQHMDDFGKGIVDTRRLVYYLSGTLFFLFLTARALEAKKWR
jgi:ABC-2 type transport system permease protein